MLLVTEVVGRLAMLHIECQFEMTGKRREMSLVVLGSAEGEQHEKRRSDILSGAKQICQGRSFRPQGADWAAYLSDRCHDVVLEGETARAVLRSLDVPVELARHSVCSLASRSGTSRLRMCLYGEERDTRRNAKDDGAG